MKWEEKKGAQEGRDKVVKKTSSGAIPVSLVRIYTTKLLWVGDWLCAAVKLKMHKMTLTQNLQIRGRK